MVRSCERVAQHQIASGRFFIIENPPSSRIWYSTPFQRLQQNSGVTWDTLHMCSFGMRDPDGYFYFKATSLLHDMRPDVLAPVFRQCKGTSSTHQHQYLIGSAPGHGSRAKLAQLYPYRFCQTLRLSGQLSWQNFPGAFRIVGGRPFGVPYSSGATGPCCHSG